MIDNAALLLFGLLIVYTVFRAIKLDRQIPWFSKDSTPVEPPADRKPTVKK
ncbi:hypothetical protein [Telluria beijingensis]|uniref:hypothetical protein n=1 Tax=Telluria beijingensis TaxID=3068633 RepID=UPI002796396A|nr:hypothetical protein [Massilia sp. REN29]